MWFVRVWSSFHSARRVMMGSTREARRAGIQQATATAAQRTRPPPSQASTLGAGIWTSGFARPAPQPRCISSRPATQARAGSRLVWPRAELVARRLRRERFEFRIRAPGAPPAMKAIHKVQPRKGSAQGPRRERRGRKRNARSSRSDEPLRLTTPCRRPRAAHRPRARAARIVASIGPAVFVCRMQVSSSI